VSDIENANRAHNLQAIEDRKVAAAEHYVEMAQKLMTEESYKDPRLQAFKQRRRDQALQLRWWKPNGAMPKKRKLQ
jgi:hypothetical protein